MKKHTLHLSFSALYSSKLHSDCLTNYILSWHPLTCFTSIVCAWCIVLIAVCAMALVVKVTNAQPGERTKRNQVIHYFHNNWMNKEMTTPMGWGMVVRDHRKSQNATVSCKRQDPVENLELSEKLPAYLGSGHLGPVISCILQSAQRGRTSLGYHFHCTSWISFQ